MHIYGLYLFGHKGDDSGTSKEDKPKEFAVVNLVVLIYISQSNHIHGLIQ